VLNLTDSSLYYLRFPGRVSKSILRNLGTHDINSGIVSKCVCVCVCVCVCMRARAFEYNPCCTQEIGGQRRSSLDPRRANSPWHRLCSSKFRALYTYFGDEI